jgi:hypothetical protein
LLENTLSYLEKNQQLGYLSVENISNIFVLNTNEYGITKGVPVPFVDNVIDLRVYWIRFVNSTETLHLRFDEKGKIYKWRKINDKASYMSF